MKSLKADMESASASLQFERAAALRDKLDVLTWLRAQLDRIKQIRQKQSFIYPVDGVNGQQAWYFIHGGQTVAAHTAPQDKGDLQKATKLARSLSRQKLLGEHAVPVDDLDGLLLVASWFRRHPDEKVRLLDMNTLEPKFQYATEPEAPKR
jgi:excinuclease ABC subunit C